MPSDQTFPGTPVVVTGAAQGIGRDIATTFAERGARVALVDRDGDALDATVAALADKELPVLGLHHDVASWDGAQAAVDGAASAFGELAVLVNNAGGSAFTSVDIDEVDEEGLDRVLAWNIKTTFLCTKASLRHLRARGGGSIVNIGAIAGRAGTEILPPQYSAAKAGVLGLTRNLARHLGPEAIRVNCVSPGFTRSGPRVEAIWNGREDQAAVLSMIPLRRRGDSSEVSEAVLWLAGDASSYVTGAVIDVNGGFFCV
jgi:3-oxoacyl-[acyl-carrier protein] reductase/2-[hydroxy(phenyl)methyl]-succinyl-CoA dehydrogenase BbsD subunit